MLATRNTFLGVLALVAVGTLSCEKDREEEWHPSWPCTDYYLDEDGDGWGVDVTTCDWDVPDGYAARPGDCCDSDPDVHPFADFRGTPHDCPILQWDFDCDGAVEMDFPDTGVFEGCGEFCGGAGWVDGVPACGEEGTFQTCSYGGSDSTPDGGGWRPEPPPNGSDPLPGNPWMLPCIQSANWSGPRGCK